MAVLDWLLDSDPALRWQVLQDLTDAPRDNIAAERGRVPVEGWGGRLLTRPLADQFDDGGWNCEAENGSLRSSFHTTICVLEGLLEDERATGGSAESVAARHRGEEYLLQRKLFRRLSTGDVVKPNWLRFPFPTWWHYDVLRRLDNTHPGQVHFTIDEGDGEPGRWNTLRAMRVLNWYDCPDPASLRPRKTL